MTILTKIQLSLPVAVLLAASTSALAMDFKVDPAHSSIGFSVRHLVSSVPGNFKTFSGEFSFDEKKPESSKAELTIETASINTGNEKRDGHLRSPDFFDAEKFPKITFKSKKVTKKGDKKYEMEGELTMHGVPKSIPLTVEMTGLMADPMSKEKKMKAGFLLKGTIHRKEFGISWNKALDNGGWILGEDVDLDIRVEAEQS